LTNFIHNHIPEKLLEDDRFYGTIKEYDFIDKENNPRIKSEDDSRIMAKAKYRKNNSVKYLIRIDNIKHFYNPLSPLAENSKNNIFIDETEIKFKEVSRSVFDMYITFLRTLNAAWIRNAEREEF
jgi:hypothetical protein